MGMLNIVKNLQKKPLKTIKERHFNQPLEVFKSFGGNKESEGKKKQRKNWVNTV